MRVFNAAEVKSFQSDAFTMGFPSRVIQPVFGQVNRAFAKLFATYIESVCTTILENLWMSHRWVSSAEITERDDARHQFHFLIRTTLEALADDVLNYVLASLIDCDDSVAETTAPRSRR